MNKLIIFILLLFAIITGYSQNILVNINFGTSKDSVILHLKKLNGVELQQEKENSLIAGKGSVVVIYGFIENKLYQMHMSCIYSTKKEAITSLDGLLNYLELAGYKIEEQSSSIYKKYIALNKIKNYNIELQKDGKNYIIKTLIKLIT